MKTKQRGGGGEGRGRWWGDRWIRWALIGGGDKGKGVRGYGEGEGMRGRCQVKVWAKEFKMRMEKITRK